MGSIIGIKKPKVDESKYEDQNAPELRTRLYAIIDGYLKKKGLDALIPQENRPYEFLSDEEREKVRQRKDELASNNQDRDLASYHPSAPYSLEHATDEEREQATLDPATPKRSARRAPEVKNPEAETGQLVQGSRAEAGELGARYSRAAMAAALQARDYGLNPDEMSLTPPKQLAAQNAEGQQKQLDDVMDYIRMGRQYGYYPRPKRV